MSRRVYRRRADMIVFTTVAVVALSVIGIHMELQGRAVAPDKVSPPDTAGASPDGRSPGAMARLVITPTDAPPEIVIDPERLASELPLLSAALEDARETGDAEVTAPLVIDMIWVHLGEAYGVVPWEPVVVGHGTSAFVLKMSSP